MTVLVLVLLPALAAPLGGTPQGSGGAEAPAGGSPAAAVGVTLAKVAAFIAIMFVVARCAVPWLLGHGARSSLRDGGPSLLMGL